MVEKDDNGEENKNFLEFLNEKKEEEGDVFGLTDVQGEPETVRED